MPLIIKFEANVRRLRVSDPQFEWSATYWLSREQVATLAAQFATVPQNDTQPAVSAECACAKPEGTANAT